MKTYMAKGETLERKWYVVDADPGATLLYGFKHEISKDEFARRIADNTLLEVTNAVPVKKGDVFFIQAGTLHAIGKGILIALYGSFQGFRVCSRTSCSLLKPGSRRTL